MIPTTETLNCVECPHKSFCFQKLTPAQLEFIDKHKVQIKYRRGETIYKQGTFSSHLIYLVDGLAKIYFEGPENKNLIIKILHSHDYIGLSAMSGQQHSLCSASILKDSMVCLIEKEAFNTLFLKNPNFALEIIKWHCKNDDHLFKKLISIGNKQMHGRLADVLIYLNQEEFQTLDIYEYISRKDLAGLAGISVESSIRILSEFKTDKIVRCIGKKIKILKMELLQRISKTG